MGCSNLIYKDWYDYLDITLLNNCVKRLNGNYIPDLNTAFRPFQLCSYKDIEVVFIGEGPYIHKDLCNGLLYGNPYKVLSKELDNLRDCLINFEIPHNCITFDPTLEFLAKQGVLLLNTAFTTIEGRKGSHFIIWKAFIGKFLQKLSRDKCLTYVLFGKGRLYRPYLNELSSDIIEVQDPLYWKALPYNVFTELNKKRINTNLKPIKFYEEESLSSDTDRKEL